MTNAIHPHNRATALLSLSLTIAMACGSSTTRVHDASSADAPTQQPAKLSFDVFVSDASGFHASSTLIMNDQEAILIDAQFNLKSGEQLADWVASKGRTLKAIYITHAHPDHYFGAEKVLEKFPETPVYATPDVIAHMEKIEADKLAYWGAIYKSDLTTAPVNPTPVASDSLQLGDVTFDLVTVEQGDADPSTIVHVPELSLVVAGDVTFQGVHAWLAEAPGQDQRDAWLRGLSEVAALAPEHVIAGHRGPNADSTNTSIAQTRNYIEDFSRLRREHASAKPFIAAMSQLYPDSELPIILQIAAEATYAQD